MHQHTLEQQRHHHNFSTSNSSGEQRTRYVLWLTLVTMVIEIVAGSVYGSMALLADGWHMGTHVAAFMITLFAYSYARKHANNPAYSFGTGKVNVLGGFASAVALAIVALMMLLESTQRLIEPHTIRFNEAIAVAVIGLLVNLVSAWLLKDHHHHDHHGHSHHHHDHDHDHDHHHEHDHEHHKDHNLHAAYMHVLADALTSLLAIVALVAGKTLGWSWLDPLMGIVGAVIITRWAWGLMKQTSPILLDASVDTALSDAIRATIESDADNRVSDLHVWRVSGSHHAAIIALVTHQPKPVEHYRELLMKHHQLAHVTIEVQQCAGDPCAPSAQQAAN
ncbi:CDF family Co(II)/Ni(II) efflux transporter DmeF [Pseudomaricurvus sp. HS19]|uniref:CDF family Co(II)/Ni(II) efflux transporter DmeF n=1 Tax=Pseudomaricurvus sp. HS19 TaxID=2692626 RepID=UPI00136FBB2C|nr:CDF family Co(II)/Ni(II) efflux transporter DmeF [Pseudomaricurvus sp. HS19]MYM63953.1 CDF family Co(II)/Ni(II) efflux transporter DmeF [Pseudomaricurvus sp. HS19]